MLKGHKGNIPSVSFLEDSSGRWLAGTSIEGEVILWDVDEGVMVEGCRMGLNEYVCVVSWEDCAHDDVCVGAAGAYYSLNRKPSESARISPPQWAKQLSAPIPARVSLKHLTTSSPLPSASPATHAGTSHRGGRVPVHGSKPPTPMTTKTTTTTMTITTNSPSNPPCRLHQPARSLRRHRPHFPSFKTPNPMTKAARTPPRRHRWRLHHLRPPLLRRRKKSTGPTPPPPTLTSSSPHNPVSTSSQARTSPPRPSAAPRFPVLPSTCAISIG